MPSKELIRYGFALAALVFTGYVVLDALGRDTTQLFTWITGAASTIISGFVLLKQNVHGKTIDEVSKQVNGRMTQLIEKKTLPSEDTSSGIPGNTPNA